ncbi:MAG: hypothetical protein WDN46_10330 [Methylocella sp.]
MAEKPVVIKGITAEDFQQWKHNPVSKVVLAYFADYADALTHDTVTVFLQGGALVEPSQLERRGRILAAKDASELEFESLRSFYEGEESSAAENS